MPIFISLRKSPAQKIKTLLIIRPQPKNLFFLGQEQIQTDKDAVKNSYFLTHKRKYHKKETNGRDFSPEDIKPRE